MRRTSSGRSAVVLIGCITLMSSVASVHADNRLSNKGHWDRTGAVAHVKFLDHTDSPWPVDTASADWDEANQIDVDWQLTDGSPSVGPAVYVSGHGLLTRTSSSDPTAQAPQAIGLTVLPMPTIIGTRIMRSASTDRATESASVLREPWPVRSSDTRWDWLMPTRSKAACGKRRAKQTLRPVHTRRPIHKPSVNL